MSTSSIVEQPDGGRDRELTRITAIHNSLLTWAVHDGQVCVALEVTPGSRIFAGVFSCRTDAAGDPCPWLGTCDHDAYVTSVAQPVYDQAAASGFDDAVIYELLEQLHADEVAR